MKDIFENIFSVYHKRYVQILNQYYPAHNSTGFTERNLSHNFVRALETVFVNKTIPWFEAPIDFNLRKHLDAVVFSQNHKTSFFIESKRFTDSNTKIISIANDIKRILTNIKILENGLVNTIIENRFAVILADVWTETKGKEYIFNKWPECLSNSDIYWHSKAGFEELNTNEDWKINYKLLIAVIKIDI
jgi:hypothetical protein